MVGLVLDRAHTVSYAKPVPEDLGDGILKGRQRQLLPSSLGAVDATSKLPSHCGRQKLDSTRATKMLLQMSL